MARKVPQSPVTDTRSLRIGLPDMPHIAHIAPRWTLPASMLLHGLALALLVALTVPRALQQPPMRTITVDLVPAAAEPPPPAVPATEPATEPTPVPPPVVEPPPPAPAADGMVAATDFYASGILSDPANTELREIFPLLATSEQVTQLCNMEALEQLRSARPAIMADALVGYAFDSIAVSGNELDAEGGAVRSGGRWFHFRYRCAVAPDITSVSAFEYAMGAAIPPDQWEEHFLNADDDWLN